jgi:hypothetical protein
MVLIEPHIHMYSRTTDDYQAMYRSGIRACVEPSFWLGSDRRHAGTFFDYFRVILEFETVRARRFGIDHYCAISVNPKETEDRKLVDEVLAGMGTYLDHPRCVAVGEIGFNHITPNEEYAFVRQLAMAKERNMPVMIHLPHTNKPAGAKRILEILRAEKMDESRIDVDHNTEETMDMVLRTGCFAGMTVYPLSKLSPERVSAMIRKYGSERMIVNGSADWGISDPLSLCKVVETMRRESHTEAAIQDIVFNNAMTFFGNSPRWQPELELDPVDPRTFQR